MAALARTLDGDLTLDRLADIVDARGRHFRRNLAIVGVAGLLVGGGLTAAGFAVAGARSDGVATVSTSLESVAVEQRDVNLYTDFAGTLGYGSTIDVGSPASGVVTSVPEAGTDLGRGAVLFEVDSEPVVLLYGDLPIWRSLSRSSDAGPDILQLETNLAALGYTANGNMTVDEDFTYYTGVALKAWETAVGFSSPDTTFDAGEAVYLPGVVRVDATSTRGTVATSGATVLSVAVVEDVSDTVVGDHGVTSESAPTQEVTLQVATSDQSLFVEGMAVEVELADASTVAGTIGTVGQTVKRVSTGPNSELYVDVTVAVVDEAGTGLVEGPVTVHVPSETVTAALMVPVRALVALAEGGYAVQVQADDGTATYVGVKTGVFSDGWVEVTGDVAEGDMVLVPA
jgi:peptidoglycan hydrolase-like protein with peptidoglycan-binding domain